MNERTYKAYVQILEDELIVATGCTEPIAIAFASAKAAQVLGSEPERISISVSGNIIKNVHSVTVPNTGGQHGVKTAVGRLRERHLRCSQARANRGRRAGSRCRAFERDGG